MDACWAPDGRKITEEQTYGQGECSRLYPAYGSPRIVAGEPLASNIVACKLQPIDTAEYPQPVTRAQLRRLEKVFPKGVCNWSLPGRWQRPLAGPWISFP